MNALASSLLWLSVQVALFSLVGCAAFYAARRRGPQAAATCTAIVLGLTLILTAMIASPWPRWMAHAQAAKSQAVALIRRRDSGRRRFAARTRLPTPINSESARRCWPRGGTRRWSSCERESSAECRSNDICRLAIVAPVADSGRHWPVLLAIGARRVGCQQSAAWIAKD